MEEQITKAHRRGDRDVDQGSRQVAKPAGQSTGRPRSPDLVGLPLPFLEPGRLCCPDVL